MHEFVVSLGWRESESHLQLPILQGLVFLKPVGLLSSVPQILTHIMCIPVEDLLKLKYLKYSYDPAF